jgi:hypothetical protein
VYHVPLPSEHACIRDIWTLSFVPIRCASISPNILVPTAVDNSTGNIVPYFNASDKLGDVFEYSLELRIVFSWMLFTGRSKN